MGEKGEGPVKAFQFISYLIEIPGDSHFRPGRSHPERLTQVHLTDLGVGKDFLRTAGCDYAALIDDVGAGADPEGLADIMVSDEHADAAGGELADDALGIEHRERGDTPGTLRRAPGIGARAPPPGGLPPPPPPR